jgi:hypothetical protein
MEGTTSGGGVTSEEEQRASNNNEQGTTKGKQPWAKSNKIKEDMDEEQRTKSNHK